MIFQNQEEVKVCVREDVRCKYLIGSLKGHPIVLMCTNNKDCGLDSCADYEGAN